MEGKEIEAKVKQLDEYSHFIFEVVEGKTEPGEVKSEIEVVRGIGRTFKAEEDKDLQVAGQKILDLVSHALKMSEEIKRYPLGSRALRKRANQIQTVIATMYRALDRVSETLNERGEKNGL